MNDKRGAVTGKQSLIESPNDHETVRPATGTKRIEGANPSSTDPITKCERRMATPRGERCGKPVKYLWRWNLDQEHWLHVCGRHATLTPWNGERKLLNPPPMDCHSENTK